MNSEQVAGKPFTSKIGSLFRKTERFRRDCQKSSVKSQLRSHGSVGRTLCGFYIHKSFHPRLQKFRGLPHLPSEESVDRSAMKIASRFSRFLVAQTTKFGHHKSQGRMAQLVVPTGTFSRMRDVDVNRLLASRSLESTESSPKNPNILGEIVRNVRIRSHGSVGRTHWSSYQTAGS